jgi:hypothetical protein
MPPLPTIADTFRCVLNWRNALGSHAANVIHIKAPGSDGGDVFGELAAELTDDLFGAISSDYHLTSIDVTELDGSSATVSGPPDTDVNGRATGQTLYQVAAIVKLQTARRGRSYRGRIYLGPMGEAQAESGVFVETTRVADQASWVAFSNQLVTDGMALVVASYLHETSEQVLAITVESPLATQRRRQSRFRGD